MEVQAGQRVKVCCPGANEYLIRFGNGPIGEKVLRDIWLQPKQK